MSDHKKQFTGAEIILKCLVRLGITDIFGYPGGAVIPLYDALYDCKELNHYRVRHEQGAAHSADAYGRVSGGKPGVCVATSGPGATNLVTGIMTAYMDSSPLMAITGQVPLALLGKNSFQESDILGITRPITKKNYLISKVEEIPFIFQEAYRIATEGRPGPILIDVPKDIQLAKINAEDFESYFHQATLALEEKPDIKKSFSGLEAIAEAINRSEKPLIIAGAGIQKSHSELFLKELVEKAQIPVALSLLGLGNLPATHPLFLGMLGMHGTYEANKAIQEADLILALGIRFDDRITGDPKQFATQAKIIHIDIDAKEINKNITASLSLVGNLDKILSQLLTHIEAKKRESWLKTINSLKKSSRQFISQTDTLTPQKVLTKLDELLEGQAIITTDVGQHQMWAAQKLSYNHPRSFCSSGGSGTMGFGLPAAIGAQVAHPTQQVIAIVGDGGFQMTAQELMILHEYQLPVKVILINNSYLGMVRQWQELFQDRRYSCVDMSCNPDFVALSQAYKVPAVQISSLHDLDQLKEHLETPGPMVIECVVAEEENVFPMIPAGATFSDMMIE